MQKVEGSNPFSRFLSGSSRWGHPGALAEWLRSGLQSRLHQFDSGRRLSGRSLREGAAALASPAALTPVAPRRSRAHGLRPPDPTVGAPQSPRMRSPLPHPNFHTPTSTPQRPHPDVRTPTSAGRSLALCWSDRPSDRRGAEAPRGAGAIALALLRRSPRGWAGHALAGRRVRSCIRPLVVYPASGWWSRPLVVDLTSGSWIRPLQRENPAFAGFSEWAQLGSNQ